MHDIELQLGPNPQFFCWLFNTSVRQIKKLKLDLDRDSNRGPIASHAKSTECDLDRSAIAT